ncbi:hypothetical protein [Streptomyces sp. KR55]|uniref:hypothetical protein n=1 Tax=Streptomyces sp. KR55 TaxID=3457425 RepID=UPI003FD1BB7A
MDNEPRTPNRIALGQILNDVLSTIRADGVMVNGQPHVLLDYAAELASASAAMYEARVAGRRGAANG